MPRSRAVKQSDGTGISAKDSAAVRMALSNHRDQIAASVGLTDTTEIDALLEDLQTAILRAAQTAHALDQGASLSAIRHNLLEFRRMPTIKKPDITSGYDATLARISPHYPGGTPAIYHGRFNQVKFREGIDKALALLPPKRGRPSSSASTASKQLALELIHIFVGHCGEPVKGKNFTHTNSYLPFKHFVKAVWPTLGELCQTLPWLKVLKSQATFCALAVQLRAEAKRLNWNPIWVLPPEKW
jgi:hypothetical protein